MRNADGTFLKGSSGNPRGRPRHGVTEALRRLADPEAIAQALLDLALDPHGRVPDRIAALAQVTDRLEGKALSRSEVVAEVTSKVADPYENLSDEELHALHKQLLAELAEAEGRPTGLLPGDESDAEIVVEKVAAPPSPEAPSSESRTTGRSET